VVTTLFAKTTIPAESAVALVCGPPIMFRFVIQELLKLGFSEEAIILTLERHMKCGIGKCGHCNLGPRSEIRLPGRACFQLQGVERSPGGPLGALRLRS